MKQGFIRLGVGDVGMECYLDFSPLDSFHPWMRLNFPVIPRFHRPLTRPIQRGSHLATRVSCILLPHAA